MLALRPSRILPIALAAAVGLSTVPARAEDEEGSHLQIVGSRWIAALPFGVGQMQNGDVGLGVAFAVGEALLAGASIASDVMVLNLASTNVSVRSSTRQPVDVPALDTELRTLTTVNRVTFAGFAALAAAGVIEAEVSFGPRSLPRTTPAITATAAPLPGGGVVGLRACF